MRTLIVFYSLTGTTRRVAEALAAELGAEVEEIRCRKYRPGFFGFWRAGYASWKSKIPEIEPPKHKPSDYDLVVVGGPVWAWNACTPVRAYLMREAARLPAVAFFVTVGGVGFDQALATMEALAGRKPGATLVLRTEDFKRDRDQTAVAAFAASLRRSKAA
jgi:flavodoxin